MPATDPAPAASATAAGSLSTGSPAKLAIETRFDFTLEQPTDILLQFEVAAIPEQAIVSCTTKLPDDAQFARVPAQDGIGERIWLNAEGQFAIEYTAEVEPQRLTPDLAPLARLDPHELPGEAVQYLMDSRYCPADRLQSFVAAEFDGLTGGAQIVAMRDWVADRISYSPGVSTPSTTALDTFVERHGICRDFAHVLITFARAAAIPARYASVYAPDVTPPDFHAVAEVFLADPGTPGGGAWYLVDATGMAEPHEMAKIGIGRDAADVSFLTSFGNCQFGNKEVSVRRL